MKRWALHLIAMLVLCTPLVAAESLTSPDAQVAVHVEVGDGIAYSVDFQGQELLASMPLSLTLREDIVLG